MQEGAIKYWLNHTTKPLPTDSSFSELNSWRTIMHRLTVIGQKHDRYAGLGYGNISQRIQQTNDQFIISGTQTGHIETLTATEYCLISATDPYQNKITSAGLCKPSSEALTHAMVYRQDPEIECVIHGHCPEIWNNTEKLQLPSTAKDIAYGTAEMAIAVKELFTTQQVEKTSLFTMLGHEDGVIAFAPTIERAALLFIHYLFLAIHIDLQ